MIFATKMASDPDPPAFVPPLPELPEHYRVWRREDGSWWQLGRGTVYKATDERTGETVALRFIDAGTRTQDAMGALAEYAARLARPGSALVAPLRDFFISGPFNVAATGFVTGESLAERVRRAGPLLAGPAWNVAEQLLEALGSLHTLGIAHGSLEPSKILFPGGAGDETPLVLVEAGLHPSAGAAADFAAGTDATREDLRWLGISLWFALTGDALTTPTGEPLPWQRLDSAGITPALGALPVLLARTLTGEPSQRPATARALQDTLNMLAPWQSMVSTSTAMPSRVPAPAPVAPTPEPRPAASAYEDDELWPRTSPRLSPPNRRRRKSRQIWISLAQLALGGIAGFCIGVNYEKHHGWAGWFGGLHDATPAVPAVAATAPPTLPPPKPAPSATPEPDLPLLPSPPVNAAATGIRLNRLQSLQPDAGDILKYARQLRRVATLPVNDAASFPSDAQVGRLLERFDWNNPGSPNFHRTALVFVLGYSDEQPAARGQAASQQNADVLAQTLAVNGITSPIYTCGMGSGNDVPEVEATHTANGQFVEVWVAFTLF